MQIQKVKRIVYGQATSDANGIATLYFTDNALRMAILSYLLLTMQWQVYTRQIQR